MDRFLPIPDSYERRARILPALIVAFLPGLWTLTFGGSTGLMSNIALTSATILALLIGSTAIIRVRGQAAQQRLFAVWGGAPVVRLLRHCDGSIDPITKQRYHRFLSAHVPGFLAPSPAEEANDPKKADAHYASAMKWLLEFTRNPNFPRVAQENANYGLHRNLYAMRGVGQVVSIACLAWAVLAAFRPDILPLVATTEASLSFAAIAALFLLIWTFYITPEFVGRAAHAYALALLAACESESIKTKEATTP